MPWWATPSSWPARSAIGAELTVYGEALPGLRVLGGASFLDTDVAGKQAIGSPKSQFSLGFDFDVTRVEGLAFNVRAVQTAKQYADAANTQVVPAWTRLDIGARYAFDVSAHEQLCAPASTT